MTVLELIHGVADLAMGADKRVADEHQKFLSLYRDLVKTVPSEVAERFGALTVAVIEKGKENTGWSVLLTATDYLFWKQKIAQGVRFSRAHGGVTSVPRAIAVRLAKQAEEATLTIEERRKLLKLLDEFE